MFGSYIQNNKRRILLALSLICLIALVICYFTLNSEALNPNRSHAKPGITRNDKSSTPHVLNSALTLDSDDDGIPDFAELPSFTDRENFTRWFTSIAEMQFYQLSDEWNPSQRDCAGLVRFAWREALRHHDRQWFRTMGEDYAPVAPDVQAYSLTSILLGEKIFRTSAGSFNANAPLNENFSEYADARTLKSFNSTYISRDRAHARPGDLLFFYQPSARKYPYHVMIFLGDASINSDESHDWVVYHTGASANDAGTVKKVRLAVLDQHPDKRWRPLESNPNFLGYFRLRILQ